MMSESTYDEPSVVTGVDATAAERELLQKYVGACEQPDLAGFVAATWLRANQSMARYTG